MKKHMFALLLVVALIVGMIPTTVMATEETVDIKANVNLILTGKPTLVVKYKAADVAAYDDLKVSFDVADTEPVTPELDDNLYVSAVEVTAARLHRPIHVALKNGDEVVDEFDFTLEAYVANITNADPALSDLADSLMAYSNYAAAYNGATDTKEFQSVQKVSELTGYNSVVVKNSVTGIGVIPVLNDACDLYFTFPEGITGCTVKVNDEAVELKPTEGVLDTAKPYYYAITGILPQNWADPVVVEVYEGDTLKTQFSYSVLSYVQKKLNVTENGLGELLKAMYLYHRDAEMYTRTTAREEVEKFENLDAWTLPDVDDGFTAPTINAAGQMEFNISTGKSGNYVSKAISSGTNKNSATTVIDVDFTVTGSASTEISIYNGNNPVLGILFHNGQLRHYGPKSSDNKFPAEKVANTDDFHLTVDVMHHARIVLDMTHQKYDLYVNGVQWIFGESVRTAFGGSNGLTLRMGVYGEATGTFLFDNLKISKLAASSVDRTTTGFKDTLYTDTFEEFKTTGTPKWNSAGTVDVSADKKLLLQNNTNTAALALWVPSAELTGKFAFEIDVASSVLSTDNGVYIKLGQNSPKIEDCANVKIYSNSVKYTTTDGEKSVSKQLVAGEVYRVKLIVDVDNDTFDIYINDQSVATGIAFPTAADMIDRVRLTVTKKANWNIEFDNMKISRLLTVG